jgi:hypothetical protein
MNGNKLFHVMDEAQRVVIFSMDHRGNRTVYCPGGQAVDTAWPRYASRKPYLDTWFDQHAGRVVSSPFTEFGPGTPEYPHGLASALTYDPLLSLWAYVTPQDILVSFSQAARAIGLRREVARKRLEDAGIAVNGDEGESYRTISIHAIRRAFGAEVADGLILYSGQIADFLGVHITSVPGIVDRLGIGVPGRNQVGVRWGQLRRVQRIGPRSYEVRDA